MRSQVLTCIMFAASVLSPLVAAAAEKLDTPMVAVPSGSFTMGDTNGHPNETPKRVTVKPFRVMKFEVTNKQFAAWIRASGYVTDVEKNGEGHFRDWTSSAFPGRPNDISIRGGGWGNRAWCQRVTYRHWNPPYIGLDMVGFRCVRDVK